MKISGDKPIVDLESRVKPIESNPREGPDPSSRPAGRPDSPETEKVHLSEKAKEITRIQKILESVPEVREDKVQGVSEQLEKGTYNVKAEEVAEKVLQEHLIDIFE